MNVIGNLVARERRSEDIAVRTDSRAGSYSYETFCTNSWKAGNLLRHYGVRTGGTVAVDAGESVTPPPLLAFVGAASLGATARFDPGGPIGDDALVVPGGRASARDAAPGTTVMAYAEQTEDPTVVHFEGQLWSENPVAPPDEVAPDERALIAGERSFTQGELLTAAETIVDEYGLAREDDVALRAPLTRPGAVVAGVLAPVLAGATVLVDRSATGAIAVSGDEAPESREIDPATVV